MIGAYPRYDWAQDLRRKVSPDQIRDIEMMRHYGHGYKRIANKLGISPSTARYWANRDEELAQDRRLYRIRKERGTLRRKPQEYFDRAKARKRRLCPGFIEFEKAYNRNYRREHRDKLLEYHRQWRAAHPNYFKERNKDYTRRWREAHPNYSRDYYRQKVALRKGAQ